jgi:hypothetical protein
MAGVLNQQTTILTQLMSMVADLHSDRESNRLHTPVQESTISYLHNELADVRDQLCHANAKLAVLKMPPGAETVPARRRPRDGSPCKSPRVELPTKASSPTGTNSAVSQAQPRGPLFGQPIDPAQVPIPTPAPAPTHVPGPHRALVYGAEAAAVAESNTNKEMHISIVLQDLYKTGRLRLSDWTKIDPPKTITEKSLFKCTMELVQEVVSDNERDSLRKSGISEDNLEGITQTIQRNCMKKMLEYEGLDPHI